MSSMIRDSSLISAALQMAAIMAHSCHREYYCIILLCVVPGLEDRTFETYPFLPPHQHLTAFVLIRALIKYRWKISRPRNRFHVSLKKETKGGCPLTLNSFNPKPNFVCWTAGQGEKATVRKRHGHWRRLLANWTNKWLIYQYWKKSSVQDVVKSYFYKKPV